MNAIVILRAVVFVLALALAAALIAHGNILIGGLIGALAVTRLVLFINMRRRVGRFRRRTGNMRP